MNINVNPAAMKAVTLARQSAFTRYFFKHLTGSKIIWNQHHGVMAGVLDDVIECRRNRVIITVPPGYTKTEMLKAFVARGLAKEPRARFIYTGFDNPLTLQTSSEIRDIVQLEEFQALFPMALRSDTSAKNLWRTVGHNGGVKAGSAGGGITGFRAGLYEHDVFTGALIVDDPLKPKDARYPAKRNNVNNNYNNTLRNRLAFDDETPVIIIMQRVAEDDLVGFLLGGGSGEIWDHLNLPAVIDNSKAYPTKYTHGRPIAHGLPDGALWEEKFNLEKLAAYERSDRLVFAAQYMQDPLPVGDRIFDPEWWRYYDPERPPRFEWSGIYADTAQKTKEWNDYSVLQLWGAYQGGAYLRDQIRGKWKAPELKKQTLAFIDKHHQPYISDQMRIRHIKIEDKSSGTGLIQDISGDSPVPVLPIPRSIDKVVRANDAAPSVEVGRVYLPKGASWLPTYEEEFERFSADMSHTHDDQVDPTLDAISDICGNRGGGFGTI